MKLSNFSQKEVTQLFKNARRVVRHPGIHILVAPASKPTGRILVVTPKKIGNAPTRNRIRRRFKALFHEDKLFEQGKDCIIVVKKEGTLLPVAELKTLLLQAFENKKI